MRRLSVLRGPAVGAAAGLVLAGAVTAAPVAAAASGADRCPSGYFCGFTGDDGSGSMFKTSRDMPTLGSWDDKIRSYTNRSASIACLYGDPRYAFDGPNGYGSAVKPDGRGEWSWAQTFDKTVSSIKFVKSERECLMNAYPDWRSDAAPTTRAFGDLDNDRRADVLARDKAGRLWFTSGAGGARLIGGGWNGMSALTRHGDLTGDGSEDLIARSGDGRLWTYPGRGNGTFGDRRLIGGGWNSMSVVTATGDLTGDRRGDLVARDRDGRLWMYPGRGNGTFGARQLIGGGWNSMTALTGPGDLTGDGRADLVARGRDGRLWTYPGRGNGTFGDRRLVGGGWNVMDSFLSVGDYDGDGRNDLLTVTNEGYRIDGYPGNWGWLLSYRGNGNGTFRQAEQVSGEWWGLNGTY